MIFEYDDKKSQSNFAKHGIDFEEAKLLWDDAYAQRIPAFTVDGEVRYMVIGKISEKHYAAIIHERGDVTRIISVRRARKKEIEHYESYS